MFLKLLARNSIYSFWKNNLFTGKGVEPFTLFKALKC